MNEIHTSDTPTPQAVKSKEGWRKMKPWEYGALGLAFALIAFVAIPNYLNSLDEFRGKECSARLTRVANCLTFLAQQNQTQPGEKICELFDLNEMLALDQGVTYQLGETNLWLYYKLGAEPDCAGEGDHQVSLVLGKDGRVAVPTCTLVDEAHRKEYQQRGLHTCDVSKVTGEINLTIPQ